MWNINLNFSEVFQTFHNFKSKRFSTNQRNSSFCDFIQKIKKFKTKNAKFREFCRNRVISRTNFFGDDFDVFHDRKSSNKLSLSTGRSTQNSLRRT